MAAEKLATEGSKSRAKGPSDIHYRVVRDKPLLMAHVLEPTDKAELAGVRVPAMGVKLP